MRDFERARAALADIFRCGTVERDGETVALWHVTHLDDGDGKDARLVSWLGKADDGSMVGFRNWRRRGEEHLPPGRGDYDIGFGSRLAVLLGIVGAMPRASSDDQFPGRSAHAYLRTEGGLSDHAIIKGHVERSVVEPLRKIAASFVDGLDPTYLATFKRHPQQSAMLGPMWGPDADGPSPVPAALDLHPGFPNAICAMLREEGPAAMKRAISAGRLSAALVRHLGIDGDPSPRSVQVAGKAERALGLYVREQGETLARAAEDDTGRRSELQRFTSPPGYAVDWPVAMARILEGFPATWVPDDDAQWWAFARLCPVIEQVKRVYGDAVPMAVVMPSGGDWGRLLSRLMAAARVKSADRLTDALSNVNDMVRAYADQVIIAACVADRRDKRLDDEEHGELHDLAGSVLVGGRSLARILEMSADWHSRHHAMRTAIAAMPGAYLPGAGWPAGLGDATFGDIEVKVLTDAASLADEGARGTDPDGVEGLDNCAAGYDVDCLEGRSRIVSLRRRFADGTWERLSLAEISLRDPPAFAVSQHVGYGNGDPPRGAEAVLERYLDGYRHGSSTYDPDAFASLPSESGQGYVRTCGYNPTVEVTRLAVSALWDRYLPGPLRGIDADAIRRLPYRQPGECRWPAATLAPEEPAEEVECAFPF